MLRKVSLLLALLPAWLGGTALAQTDYPVTNGANSYITHQNHYPKKVGIVGTQSPLQVIENIATAPGCAAYFDHTATEFEVLAGDIVTPEVAINGDWMHSYVYVDWNGNKKFDVKLEGSGPYTQGEGNELVCWSNYNHAGDGNDGWNSNGSAVSGNLSLNPGSFTVPANLPVGSSYRIRYKVEWNNIDPAGGGSKFLSDGGSIIDVTLKITGKAEQTTLYPLEDYAEPRVGTAPNETAWNMLPEGLQATWASRDVHYSLHDVPEVLQKNTLEVHAWQGERVGVQALLYGKTDQGLLSVRMSRWEKDGQPTEIESEARFVNYVITDDYKACGDHPNNLIPWLVADVIDLDKPHVVPAMETRPVWCTLEVPRGIEPGRYTTRLEVVDENGSIVKQLVLHVNVNHRALPTVAEQKFHLDFWQQPYAVSRYHEVERWSDAHFEALRPYLAALARAGQRTVSAIMFYEPWGKQSHDKFDPMITTTRKADGTWAYNYDIFDRYVLLCEEFGIDKQINCFSMVPWDMSFRYFDEASGEYRYITTKTSTEEYRNLWNNFLKAFKNHLIEKGWFDKTNIAMDERSEADMLNAYNIANALGFKMALAGNYHASLCDKLQDFCVALGQDKKFTDEQLASRKAKKQITTVYTSCADTEPNIYSNSLPAEATFLPLYAAANELDGYLHWAWINWDEHPLTDSRFRMFGAGDTYCFYPGPRSSIRYERLIEGIHQYEKVQILKEEYKNKPAQLDSLNLLLKSFENHAVSGEDCAQKVSLIESFLNGQPVEIPQAKDVVSGYYRMASRAANRTEHIYNNALLSGNSYAFTLQSNVPVATNNGVWYVDVPNGAGVGAKIQLKNGDGRPLVAGKAWGASVAGTFNELTIGLTDDAEADRYYFFTEAINCTNGENNFKVGGVDYVTTWTDGPATAADQQWRFDPVELENRNVYSVAIADRSDLYIAYQHEGISEYAFDGGFFICDKELQAEALSLGSLGGEVPENLAICVDHAKKTIGLTSASAVGNLATSGTALRKITVYNLTGRRVSDPSNNVYIVDGKKKYIK
ncbi:MAG: DUF4091 domain-containing protein [Bacteroidaceae bacterium]|nr:DUF4091 domain-containing protein [Bacteroidaceae bacterium]